MTTREGFESGLRSWELDAGEWERASGTALADAVKYTVMMNMTPNFLETVCSWVHMPTAQLFAHPRCSGVTPLETLERIRPRKSGNGTSADDDRMQVDSPKKGKRKGKGKKTNQRGKRTTNTSSTDINTCKNCGNWNPGGGAYDNSACRNTGEGKSKNTGKGERQTGCRNRTTSSF